MKRVRPGGRSRNVRPTSATYMDDATSLQPVQASPSPARSPATPLPFNPVDPFLDPVRWQHSRFNVDNDEDALPIPHRATRGFAVPADDGQVFAPGPDGVAYPSIVRDLDKTTFTWEQLEVKLEDCDFDIDTIIAPLYVKSFHKFSNWWTLAGSDRMSMVHNNFPHGMVITLHPWMVILQMDLPNIPNVSRAYADALHAAAKILCQAIGEYPAGTKINIMPLPDTADDRSLCLTRTQGQSAHADWLSHAFQKLEDSLEFDATFQLFICRYDLKGNCEEVYAPLMRMYEQMRIAGDEDLEEMYKQETVLHVGVDFLTSSGHIVLAKGYKLQQLWEGQPAKFSHYPYLGRLGNGFGGSSSKVKDLENCESTTSGYTQYTGPMKRGLLAICVPTRKWLGLNNDQQSICRLQPEFEAWKEGLQTGGLAQRIAGARLEVYTTCSMTSWACHKEHLLPIFTNILRAMDFRLVRVSDYFQQFNSEYELAISLGCFRSHGSDAGCALAEPWKQLGCQRLRMLVGWAHTPENKCAYHRHKEGVHFKDLRPKDTGTGMQCNLPKYATSNVPAPVFPGKDGVFPDHQESQSSDEPQQPPQREEHVFSKIPDGVFEGIGFPMLIQRRKKTNSMNELPVPALCKWSALVEALSAPGGVLQDTSCTGQQLHDLAAQVEWRGFNLGRATLPVMGWACKTFSGSLDATSGLLGHSLGEAAVNLWMKMRTGTFTPLKKV